MRDSTRILAVLVVFGDCVMSHFAGAAERHDVVVYGATSGGVVAAVQAARMGRTVVLLEPGGHVGGMTASGLGMTDTAGYPQVIGGLAREFYHRLYLHYQKPGNWKFSTLADYRKHVGDWTMANGMMLRFEPHVAEKIFEEMLAEAKVEVVRGERLDLKKGVEMEGKKITAVRMESGKIFKGSMFVDASYEGDLLPLAGVSHTYGRESRSQYGEHYAGIQKRTAVEHNFRLPVDPFVKPGDPSSGLLPGVHHASSAAVGEEGAGDKLVQAFNFRLCLTNVPENRVPITKPDDYDPKRYELLGRYFEAGFDTPMGLNDGMPNHKTDFNNFGPFSVDYLRGNDGYLEGGYAVREKIAAEHVKYQQGLMYFFRTDPRVPEKTREDLKEWGLAKDEFSDNGNWPWQLYVRESRRMIGQVVMTEHHITGGVHVEDPVGMGCYALDAHNYQRYVNDEGKAMIEGGIFLGKNNPYGISFRSIVPKRSECENLVVPWSLSASHVAFLSIRMEPVLMVLSQSGVTAACMALEKGTAIQDVDYAALRGRLLADGQVINFAPDRPYPSRVEVKDLKGVVVDDLDITFTDDWDIRYDGKFVGDGFRSDLSHGKGDKTFTFTKKLPSSGRYEVRYAYQNRENASANVPLTIRHAEGNTVVRLDLAKAPPIDGLWVSLGTFGFGEKPAEVFVDTKGTTGAVYLDAIQFLPVGGEEAK